jgi:AraC-like DNA-binding protein
MPVRRYLNKVRLGVGRKVIEKRFQIHKTGLALLFDVRHIEMLEVSHCEQGSPAIYDWVNHVLQSASPAMPGTVATTMVNRVVRAGIDLGINRLAIMNEIGLGEARLRNPLSWVAGPVLLRLFGSISRKLDDPLAPLRLGQYAGPRNFSDPGYATRLAGNLAGMIYANAELQATRQKMMRVTFEQLAQVPTLKWTLLGEDHHLAAPFIEFSVSSYARFARDVLGERMEIRRIDFAHTARAGAIRYEAFFDCPVRFNAAQTMMEMASEQLLKPSPNANPALQVAATKCYQRPAFWLDTGKALSAHCYLYLLIEIDKTPLKLDRIAAAFGMSERTLRRRLVEEGNPFRELLDLVRRDMWELYRMEATRPLGEIAHLLGYSELSAFTRSHKRWFSFAPSRVGNRDEKNGGRSKV